ncbi:MAG: biotin--[acetyl-CoA-carboxylase] ligase [Mycobacteriales bacterium]
MSGRYSNLDRPPLSAAALRRALVRPGSMWSVLDVVNEAGSTNADLAAAAASGASEGTVLIAESQVAGTGRMGRTWLAPPRAGLTFSVLLRPAGVPPARRGWLPLLAGIAVADAVDELAQLPARLKWPNDVLISSCKLAGILARAEGDAVVIGIGLNVTSRDDELPQGATSLAQQDAACIDRDPMLRAILRGIEREYGGFSRAGGDADRSGVRERYLRRCETTGSDVLVMLPGGAELLGTATGVDGDARLLVEAGDGVHAIAAGDVTHVRTAAP